MSKRIMRILAVALVALLVNANFAYAATGTGTEPANPTTASDPTLQNGTGSQTVDGEQDGEDDRQVREKDDAEPGRSGDVNELFQG